MSIRRFDPDSDEIMTLTEKLLRQRDNLYTLCQWMFSVENEHDRQTLLLVADAIVGERKSLHSSWLDWLKESAGGDEDYLILAESLAMRFGQ